MKVAHPHADRDASPAAVTVGTDTYPVDEDGIIQCPADRAAEVADVLARVYDVPPDGLLTREDEPPDRAACHRCGLSHDDGACWDLIDDGICPWCDEYEGENVGMHASRAHPDDWARYKED